MRRFLQGLGVGILLAAIFMGMNYRSEGANLGSGDEIIERARELGMVFPRGSESPEGAKQQDNEAASGSAASATSAPGKGAGADPSLTKAPTAKLKATDKPKKATATPKSSAPATPTINPANLKKGQKVNFTVESGLLSSSVARELKKAGIIADDTEFDHYLLDKGLGKKVIAGTYELKVGDSYDNIAKIITHTR